MAMTDTQRVVLGAAVAAIAGFAIGAGWQYSSAKNYRSDLESTRIVLDSTHHELTYQRLEATLGAATIEAQRGNHESARRLASDFFTTLQAEFETAPPQAQPALRRILDQRDSIITELSRARLESGGVLAELFAEYRTALGEPVGPIPVEADVRQPAADSGM
jgi:hypothetical protein